MRAVEVKEKIVALIKQTDRGLTTNEISQKIELSRPAASNYLNELKRENQIKQVGTRPILWQWNRVEEEFNEEDVFRKYIGAYGSVSEEIERCKAAVLYPPQGLSLLIHGSSGVGKSFLAGLIFSFLRQNHSNCSEKFLVLNCADYANNPELLSSMLFGHVKGAFTGAETTKQGLLAQADGGVLFLDEVHRLSYENQEKLFQFMDKGNFRPVGGNEEVQHANVRLLFATTENPVEVLLPTFYRRISVCIELPEFHQRPISERMEILEELFIREARKIDREITIEHAVLYELANRKINGNVGRLSNLIQMLCAKAIQQSKKENEIIISRVMFGGKSDLTEPKEQQFVTLLPDTMKTQEKYLLKESEIGHLILKNLTNLSYLQEKLWTIDKERLAANSSHEDVTFQYFKKMFIADYERLSGRTDLENMVSVYYRFLQQKQCLSTKEFGNARKLLMQQIPRTFSMASKLVNFLNEEIRDYAAILLTIFLYGEITEEIPYQTLLVAHGDTTATSIQAVTNQLCRNYIFDAINVPIYSSVSDVVKETKKWLQERDTSKGVILLVDMGSLTQIYKNLKPQIRGELLVVNNLTTSFALEVGQQILNGLTFKQLVKHVKKNFSVEVQYFEGFSEEKNIIISCISGIEVAQNLKKVFSNFLSEEYQILTLEFNQLLDLMHRAREEETYLKETACILTTSYLSSKQPVRNINLLDAIDEEGKQVFEEVFSPLVHRNSFSFLVDELIRFFSKEGLAEKLTFLNPDIIIHQVEEIVQKIERRFRLALDGKVKLNLMMHLAVLVERTILGEVSYPVPVALENLCIHDQPFFQNMKNILCSLEQFYRMTISDWELYVLYELVSAVDEQKE
ncbi:MAG: sigma 54-interacting transcriptional regulator [Lactobacillales bacterium]|nr:sigma 54-interacting transcriptional regulator [Lactobacillales bacterium]